MKVTIPEIAWHNRDPVFSADFSQEDGAQWRMATSGADSDVKVTLFRTYFAVKYNYCLVRAMQYVS